MEIAENKELQELGWKTCFGGGGLGKSLEKGVC